MSDLQAYQDPNNPGNKASWHTGKPCIEPGCEEPAGTAWSPYWCFKHNVARMDRIAKTLRELREELRPPSD